TAMANVADFQIEMIAPEKWRYYERLLRSKNVPRGDLALPLRQDPVFHSDAPSPRIGPASDVACGKNSLHIRLQEFVHQHAVVSRDARLFGERCIRAYADPDDNQVALQNCSVIELDMLICDDHRRSTEMKYHAVCFVSFANELAQCAPENFRERVCFWAD